MISVTWNIAPVDGKTFEGGTLLCIDRTEANGYVVYNLSAIEASKSGYNLTGLINGRNYLIQYHQTLSDMSQISTLTMQGTPTAPPSAVELVDVVVTESSGVLSATVQVNNPNLSVSATLIFNVLQVHQDYPSIENDDPNASGGVDVRDDIINYMMPVDGNYYTLPNMPPGHHRICAVYRSNAGTRASNLLDVYVSLTPNDFSTLQVESGHDGCILFSFTATDNPSARIATIVATLLQNDVELSTIELVKFGTGNSWGIVGNNITGSGAFTEVNGVPLTNKTVYTVSLSGKTAPHPNSIEDDTDVIFTTPITSTGVPAKYTTASVSINRTSDGTLTGITTTTSSDDSFLTNYYGMEYVDALTDLSVEAVKTIPETQFFNGFSTVQVLSVIDPTLVPFWTYPTLIDLAATNTNSALAIEEGLKGWAHPTVTSETLVLPNSVTCVAESGINGKLSFTFDCEDTTVTKIRAILSLNDVVVSSLDMVEGNGWTRSNGSITGTGEFTGLTNGSVYKLKMCTFANLNQSKFAYTSGVPALRGATTLSFIPTEGITTTGYFVSVGESTFNNFVYDVRIKDRTGQTVEISTEYTDTIDSDYIYDGYTATATVSTIIDTEISSFWIHPVLTTSASGKGWVHDSVTERLDIEVQPDKVDKLQLVTHNTIAYMHAFDPNTQPDFYTVYLNGVEYDVTQLGEESPVIKTKLLSDLTVDETYTVEVSASNNTGESEKASLTFTYVTTVPELASFTHGQDGYSLLANLLGVVSSDGDWDDRSALADITITSESGSVTTLTNVSVDSTYSLAGAYGDRVEVLFFQKAMYSLYPAIPLLFEHDFEYSPGQSVLFTFDRHPATFSGLTWTQNSSKLDNGYITWAAPTLLPGATVGFTYTLTKNEVTSTAITVSTSDAQNQSLFLEVQYNVTVTMALTATVSYNGGMKSHTETILFTPETPEFDLSVSFSKVSPWAGVSGNKVVSYAFTIDSGYTMVSAKVKYDTFDSTEYVVDNTFTMQAPGSKLMWFNVTASITNGSYPTATRETGWIAKEFVWAERPMITYDAAQRIPGGSSITYTVHNNGAYVTSVLGMVIPASTEFSSTSITFTKTFEWASIVESKTFTQDFDYDIFPNLIANKDEVSLALVAANSEGFDRCEQNLGPVEVKPSSVDIQAAEYNASNSTVSFASTWDATWEDETTRPDHFSYYMVKTSDNTIVLDSLTMNTSYQSGHVYTVDIAEYVVRGEQYTFHVRSQNSSGVSDYASVTFFYMRKPDPVNELQLITHDTVQFGLIFDEDTRPTLFTVYVNGTPETFDLDPEETSPSIHTMELTLTVDETYTVEVSASNNSGESAKQSLSFTYVTNPPPLASIAYGQVGYSLNATLQGVVTSGGAWSDRSAFALIDITTESGTSRQLSNISITSAYTITGLAYGDQIDVSFYQKAKYTYTGNFEYSLPQTVSFTMNRHPATFSGLTFTQNSSNLDIGTVSWVAPTLLTGATVAYTYTLSGGIATAISPSGTIPVQYAEQLLAVTATVTYNGGVATHTEELTITPGMPDLTPTISFTKNTPWDSVNLEGEVLIQLELNNGYSYDSVLIMFSDDGVQWLGPFDGINFVMTAPGKKLLRIQVTATLTNGSYPLATKVTEWIEEEFTWAEIPTLTFDSAARTVGGSSITYSINTNGSYVTNVVGIVFGSPTFTFTNSQFSWDSIVDTKTFTQEFEDDIFPNTIANKDEVSIALFATNSEGTGDFVQIIETTELTPSPVTIQSAAHGGVISFIPTWADVSRRPDFFSYYMTRSSDNAIVLNSTTMNESYTSGHVFTVDVTSYSGDLDYTFNVRAENSAGVSAYATVTLYNTTVPSAVTALTVVDKTASFISTWDDGNRPISFSYHMLSNGATVLPLTLLTNTYTSGITVTIDLTGYVVLGTTYTFYVRAENSSGFSTDETTFTYTESPSMVTDLTSANETVSFVSAWVTGKKPTSFSYYMSSNGYTVWSSSLTNTSTSGNTFTVDLTGHFTFGTTYTFYVQAVNDAGGSGYKNITFTYNHVVPAAVTIQSATYDVTTNHSISFASTWVDESRPDFFSYIMIRNSDNAIVLESILMNDTYTSGHVYAVNFASYAVQGLEYTFRLRAANSAGVSAVATVTFLYIDFPPMTTTPKLATYKSISFNSTWTAGTAPDSFMYYIVRNYDTNIITPFTTITNDKVSGSTFTVSLSGLTLGQSYTFYVKSVNVAGSSAYNNNTFTYYEPPAPVTDLTYNSSIYDVSFISTFGAFNTPEYFLVEVQNTYNTRSQIIPITTSGTTVTSSIENLLYIEPPSSLTSSQTLKVYAVNNWGSSSIVSTPISYRTPFVTISSVARTSSSNVSFVLTWINEDSKPLGNYYATVKRTSNNSSILSTVNRPSTSGGTGLVSISYPDYYDGTTWQSREPNVQYTITITVSNVRGNTTSETLTYITN